MSKSGGRTVIEERPIGDKMATAYKLNQSFGKK
jgi:hypothetical protein